MCELVRVECDDGMAWFFILMIHLNQFTTIPPHVRHDVSNHRSLDCLFNRLFWLISTNILPLRITDRLCKDWYSSHKEPVMCEMSPRHNVVISSTVCVRTSSFGVSIWYLSADAKTKWPTLIQISLHFVYKRNKIVQIGSCIMIFDALSFSKLLTHVRVTRPE